MCPDDILRVGPKSVVYRGPDPGTVTKVYRASDGRSAREAAEVEYGLLRRVHEGLRTVDGVSCAEPLEWGEHDGRWYLTMREVAGRSLLTVMREDDRPTSREVSRALTVALEACAAVVGKPHYGLKPEDVFFDRTTGDVAILDFEPAHTETHLEGIGKGARPGAASAAVLLGRVLHLAAAPHMLRHRSAARWLVDVAVETLSETPIDRPDELFDVVRGVYRRRFEMGEVWWRPAWYRARWLDVARPALRRAGIYPGRIGRRGSGAALAPVLVDVNQGGSALMALMPLL